MIHLCQSRGREFESLQLRVIPRVHFFSTYASSVAKTRVTLLLLFDCTKNPFLFEGWEVVVGGSPACLWYS